MRWVLLTGLIASAAFANGRFRFAGAAQFGPASVQLGLGPAWTGVNTSGLPVPLVPITNYTGGYPGFFPAAYWYPVQMYQQPPPPPPPPAPPQVIIFERPAPAYVEPPPPPPPPQVIVIQQPVPVAVAPAPPPQPAEPPKPLPPRTPGPDVFSWVDADGVVNYSTRAPSDPGLKAKKLATLAK